MDAVVVLVAFFGGFSLENDETWDGLREDNIVSSFCMLEGPSVGEENTYDGSGFGGLTHGRAGSQPAHAHGTVAVVPDV